MALVNHAKKEINAKIVYFGPAGSGKSLALQYIFSRIKPALRGELKKVPAGADNLLCFDFSPFDGPLSDGYRVRLHIYTLTGRVTNPATWRMTLKGADGLIIMLDNSSASISAIQESLFQLRDFLSAYGVSLHDIPAVLQLNRCEGGQYSTDPEMLAASVDLESLPRCLSCAATGTGVLESLTTLSRLVLNRVAENESGRDSSDAGDVKERRESPDDMSEVALPDSCDAAHSAPVEIAPSISVAVGEEKIEGATLRIPLDISCGGTSRRMIVTVSVAPE